MKDMVIAFLVGVIVGIVSVVVLGLSFFSDKLYDRGSPLSSLESKISSPAKQLKKKLGSILQSDFRGNGKTIQLGFEKAEDLNFFQLTDGLYAEITSERSVDSKHSLFLEFPKGAKYPGLFWEVYNIGKVLDFSGYDSFGMDVYNNNLFPVSIDIKLKSGANYPKKVFEQKIYLPSQKWTKIRIPITQLATKLDITQISYIKIFISSPNSTIELFVDNLGLFKNKKMEENARAEFKITEFAWAEEIQPFKVGCIDSLHKVIGNRSYIKNHIKLNNKVELKLAKNETESFQVLLYDVREPLELVIQVELDGKPLLETKVFKVEFIETKRPYYPVVYVGKWPDPIIPLNPKNPITISAGEIALLWVDIKANSNIKAGNYKGKILLKDKDGRLIYQIPLQVKIWNFSLPNRASLKTAFDVYDEFFERFFHRKKGQDYRLWRAKLEKIKFSLYELMLDYKMSPMLKIVPTQKGFEEIIQPLLEKGLNCFAIGRYGGSFGNNWPKDDKKLETLISIYKNYATVLRSNHLLDMAYIYLWDEGRIGNPRIPKIASVIHRADSNLRNMVCYHGFWDPDALPNWGKDIDIWCFQIASYNKILMNKLKKRGLEIWMYVSGPDGKTPNLVIDSTAIEHRILPWIAFDKGIDGLLYWAVNFWQSPDPWKDTFNTPWQQNGNGLLFYPYKNRVIPTIRDAIFRDGIEDYEYLKLLSLIPDKELSPRERGEKKELLDLSIICPSMQNYTHMPQQLLERRDRIGEFLDSYYSKHQDK